MAVVQRQKTQCRNQARLNQLTHDSAGPPSDRDCEGLADKVHAPRPLPQP
jgi:hypothetical protein